MSEIDYTTQETKDMVKNLLRIGETIVTFTKKDGTERVLKCTLSEALIPSEHTPKGESSRAKNDDVQAVYDLENEGWRSFSWDSIIEVAA